MSRVIVAAQPITVGAGVLLTMITGTSVAVRVGVGLRGRGVFVGTTERVGVEVGCCAMMVG